MHVANDRHAEGRFHRIDGVPAQDETSGAGRYLGGSAENLAQHLQWDPVARPAHQVEAEERRCPHRIHIAQRIGDCDSTPGGRIVHYRSEEINRRYQCPLWGQYKHCGVVLTGGVDQDPRVPDSGQMAQDLRQVGGTEFTGSTRAVGECRETNAGLLVDG
jgi:hypothetical protein